ncbi:4-hydroxythreonine-4-phosphate dehydrogenase PdxA [Polynucleobacter sp. MWH-UH2A]|uniref:4-hydroxythreonine-4-phosphate dehydrogenase PdxA n=1 Tax=Polynucleobacter sp. MWH-UH2A TaxID=1855617 RepID=UPI001BFD1CAF|nr:4-hydroxythreonine-4-phosphate dehydrogenase PdxA [Polynucleobacter sp. MWH-UH2A]QWD63887.1 4-hydroxythreonine-4-phosphate dehydrogenase PdxA [Polynucleobacter sp. MWH-UH2A]
MQQLAPLVKLVITTGEPAGVGPEVSIAAAKQFLLEQANASITLLGDQNLLNKVTQDLNAERLQVEAVPLIAAATPGILNAQNGPYVIQLLDRAIDGCLAKQFDAMVTAPIQKSVINQAGLSFTGHTEYLAQRCGVNHVVMMLSATLDKGFLGLSSSRDFRVALVTTHLPLQQVPASLSRELILDTIQIVQRDLQLKMGITKPVIHVSGLNPHAGESGYLGREEIEVISPAIEAAKKMGIRVSGPYPGDTMFEPKALEEVDAFIAMYHDQGLAPFKFVTFGGGVNITLGLPIIRTSVDHGTALDIAGKGIADSGSMLEAMCVAYQMALTKKQLVN